MKLDKYAVYSISINSGKKALSFELLIDRHQTQSPTTTRKELEKANLLPETERKD